MSKVEVFNSNPNFAFAIDLITGFISPENKERAVLFFAETRNLEMLQSRMLVERFHKSQLQECSLLCRLGKAMKEEDTPLLDTTSRVVWESLKDERSNLFLIQTLLQCGGLSQSLALISMKSLKLSRVSGLATKWGAYSAAKIPLPDFPGVNP